MNRSVPAFAFTLLLAAFPLGARAASVEPAETVAAIPLDAAASGLAQVMQAHAQVLREAPLRPAPLPDPDVSAPGPGSDALAAEEDASLEPGVFNPHGHFAGDGYEPGSSIEADKNHRHSTGGGVNLSIPME